MKVHLFLNGIVNIVMTICITIAAIHFDRVSILWFYIIPFIGMDKSILESMDKGVSEKPKKRGINE